MDDSSSTADPMIPGARERNTLTHRQPGSIGGPTFGSDVGERGPSLMDLATIAEHQHAGGAPSTRRLP